MATETMIVTCRSPEQRRKAMWSGIHRREKIGQWRETHLLREHCINIRMKQVEPKAKLACQAVTVAAVDQPPGHLLTHTQLLQCSGYSS
jgi:hypothetical protein